MDSVNTRLLVHKHVKISVDEWILETTRPHEHVTILGIFGIYFMSIFMFRIKKLEERYHFFNHISATHQRLLFSFENLGPS